MRGGDVMLGVGVRPFERGLLPSQVVSTPEAVSPAAFVVPAGQSSHALSRTNLFSRQSVAVCWITEHTIYIKKEEFFRTLFVALTNPLYFLSNNVCVLAFCGILFYQSVPIACGVGTSCWEGVRPFGGALPPHSVFPTKA